jgi:hypothetical protein
VLRLWIADGTLFKVEDLGTALVNMSQWIP